MQQFNVDTPYDGFIAIFNHIMSKHELFVSEDGDQSYLGETVCIHIHDPLKDHDKLIEVSCQGQQSFDYYKEQLVEGKHIKQEDPEDEAEYTYHGRLFEYEYESGEFGSTNQIEKIVQKLTKSPYSRRAVAVTWQPWNDINAQDPPCMDILKFSIKKGKGCLTVLFRSHDALKAWPQNEYAISYLLQSVCDQLGIRVGWLEIISCDPHVYIKADQDLVKATYAKIGKHI
jgi:thymidylate synthase